MGALLGHQIDCKNFGVSYKLLTGMSTKKRGQEFEGDISFSCLVDRFGILGQFRRASLHPFAALAVV